MRIFQALYDFVDDNPMVDMVDVAYTNNPHVIARQHKMTAINSAIEVSPERPSMLEEARHHVKGTAASNLKAVPRRSFV